MTSLDTATTSPTPLPVVMHERPAASEVPDRYATPGRRGANRAMTAEESQHWQQVSTRWHASPPWTTQVEADNLAVRQMLVALYEDGVSLPSLASVAGWGLPRVSGMLHRARQEGQTSGTRRYIATGRASTARPRLRRDLSGDERSRLQALHQGLPLQPNGERAWRDPLAQPLLVLMDRLSTDRVSMSTLGAALGSSRQAVHQHLSRYRAPATA